MVACRVAGGLPYHISEVVRRHAKFVGTILRSLLTITTPDHILYGSDYPYQPENVLKANMQKQRETLESDEQLRPHVAKIMNENAQRLFNTPDNVQEMLIRISEIEVYPEYQEEYLSFARNVGAESVRKEPGVIATCTW